MPTASALVTGGAGFIGSHVADALLDAGYRVCVLDDLSAGCTENVPAGADLVQTGIESTDAAQLIRDREFDVVFHMAAQIDVRCSVRDPAADARLNIVGSVNLLEAARNCRKPPRFIFASSGGALYGDAVRAPTTEIRPKRPASPYGVAKLCVEQYLRYYVAQFGLDAVALRFANVYGPRQSPESEAGVVSIFSRRLLAGEPITIFGDGEQTRDYVYVGDVARANMLAATARLPRSGTLDARAFNIGTGTATSVTALAASLCQAAAVEAAVAFAPARPGEQRYSCLDNSKAARTLGWSPATPLERGLAHTYSWFYSRRFGSPKRALAER